MGGKPRDWLSQGLWQACSRGQLSAAKSLLARGANVNYKDAQGNTSLMVAGWEGHTELVALLLDHNAEVNGKNRFGFTSLVLALHYERQAITKLLLEAKADVNESYETKCSLFKNPLVVAAHHRNAEMTKLLLEHGADLSIADSSGRSVRDYLQQSNAITIRSLAGSAS